MADLLIGLSRLEPGPVRLRSEAPFIARGGPAGKGLRGRPRVAYGLNHFDGFSTALPWGSHFVDQSWYSGVAVLAARAGCGLVGGDRPSAGSGGRDDGVIGRYIFRTTFGAFLLVLVSLTTVIWITQALRDIDLMTSQGQTILVFIGITSLVIPQLVLIIAPIALMIAAAHVLNKLATDSEIIVMNAAGMPPWRLFSRAS